MNRKPIALLFGTVWPEPQSSAAGVRQLQWIQFFNYMGYQVIVTSPSVMKPLSTEQSKAFDYEEFALPLNRQAAIQDFLKLKNPDIVMFDRFLLEEQFGHFVYESVPNALVLLETEDLHFVRRVREKNKLNLRSFSKDEFVNLYQESDVAVREIASLKRVDFSFVVSSYEEDLLLNSFGLKRDELMWLPFFFKNTELNLGSELNFHKREGFCFIGNFRHAPNADGVRWFLSEIWPNIRSKLPSIKINIFGSYPPDWAMALHDPKKGVHVHGPAKHLDHVFQNSRINLAPLRFGAGVKGKIIDGFRYQVPVVTTAIGSEGLLPIATSTHRFQFPGLIANTAQEFAENCIQLYNDERKWTVLSNHCEVLNREFFSEDLYLSKLKSKIETLVDQKSRRNLPRFESKILRHELLNSHKYFSKWIEVKEENLNLKSNLKSELK